MRQRESGACFAYRRADGKAYLFSRAEYTRLKADWMAGKAFFEGIGFYGSSMVVKLGDVVAIVDETSEALAAWRADLAADKREDDMERV